MFDYKEIERTIKDNHLPFQEIGDAVSYTHLDVYKRQAEERIDTLTRLLEDAQKASDNQEENSDAFFKKLLLQQLGIICLLYTSRCV